MEKVRLQKIIAESGYCSRRKAEELISSGRVKVNGHPAQIGDKADLRDVVMLTVYSDFQSCGMKDRMITVILMHIVKSLMVMRFISVIVENLVCQDVEVS